MQRGVAQVRGKVGRGGRGAARQAKRRCNPPPRVCKESKREFAEELPGGKVAYALHDLVLEEPRLPVAGACALSSIILQGGTNRRRAVKMILNHLLHPASPTSAQVGATAHVQ